MARPVSVGGILGELFSLLGDSTRDFALYTFVVGGLTAVGALAGLTETASGTLGFGFSLDSTDSPASALFEFASAGVSMVATYLLLARFLAIRGRLRMGGGRFWHYLGMAILSVIAMVLGLLLLVVPGIILLVRWSAASGFVIGAGERVTGSLSASWAATRGHGWAIFLSAVILIGGILACYGVVGTVFDFAGAQVLEAISAFVEAAASGMFAALGVAIYCIVHDDARELSDVFA